MEYTNYYDEEETSKTQIKADKLRLRWCHEGARNKISNRQAIKWWENDIRRRDG